ncbi:MAG: DegT/DnrJ/EryC1/StrS family aminotransferase [Armatimonadetes bacterium]|nr:DegT/DnrJ/EryC1/StrS family aminotransferase [Armatimonadota bacterium]
MPDTRAREQLAVEGGTPVHQSGWMRWPNVSEEAWAAEVEPRFRQVYLSRTEGLPNPHAREFEEAWCRYTGAQHATLTSHGTDALQAVVAGAVDADGIGYAGEVIVPNYTFIASATAPLALQCGICLVDVEPDGFNLSPAAVEAAIGPKTVGILAVHLGGQPADLEALGAIAQKHGLALMEDCAQAHAAKHRDRHVGTIGHAAGFSFQSSKNLTSGEGGLVTTSDTATWHRAYAYLNIGRYLGGERWEHPRIGWNYRSNEYMAAVLLSRLGALEEETDRRDANGLYLNGLLAGIEGFTPPRRMPWCGRHAYHLYMSLYQPAAFGGHSRDEFLRALQAEGVPCSNGYAMPLSDQEGLAAVAERYPDRCRAEDSPNTRQIIAQSVWFTQNMMLGSRQDMDDIATAVAKIKRAWTS